MAEPIVAGERDIYPSSAIADTTRTRLSEFPNLNLRRLGLRACKERCSLKGSGAYSVEMGKFAMVSP
jgi:hypothetical protein